MLNFSWCALFYIKKFIKRKRCWYFNTKLWHLDSNARNRLVFVQLMIPSEITSNRADAKVFFGWANLSTWTFHRVKNGFKWSTPEKSHVNLLTWVAEVYLKSPESVTSFLSTSNSTSVKHRLFVFYICLPYRTPEDFSQPASVFPIFMFYKKKENHTGNKVFTSSTGLLLLDAPDLRTCAWEGADSERVHGEDLMSMSCSF